MFVKFVFKFDIHNTNESLIKHKSIEFIAHVVLHVT